MLYDNQKTSGPLNNYGAFLTETKRYEDAIAVLKRAVEIDPEHIEPLLNLAWERFQLKTFN